LTAPQSHRQVMCLAIGAVRCGPPASDAASAGPCSGCPHCPCPSNGDGSWPTTGMTPSGMTLRVGRGTRSGEATNSQGDQAETTDTSPSPQRTLQRKQLSSLSTPVHPRSVEAKMQPGDDRRATPPSNPSWNPPITAGKTTPTSAASPPTSAACPLSIGIVPVGVSSQQGTCCDARIR